MSAVRTSPLKGLLLYFLYDASGKLAILFFQAIAWGIAFLIFGGGSFGPWLQFFFGVNAVMGVSMVVITGMGNREIDWERFQLSMPVRRRNLASSQYLSVGLAPIIGIPLFVLFTWLSSLFHEEVYFTFLTAFVTIAPFLSMPYIMGGLVFPVYMLPVAEKLHEGLFPAVILVSVVIPQLVVGGANRWGWSMVVASVLMLAVSMVIFIVSYFITRRIYEKQDF